MIAGKDLDEVTEIINKLYKETVWMEVNFDEQLLEGLRVDPNYDEPVLNQALRIAMYDEYHAYEAYRKIIDTFGNVRPFSNIIEAEIRHYNALAPLLEKYGVPLPIDNWYDKIELPDTLLECCEVGVAAEIDNVRMYDNLLIYAEGYPDIQDIFYQLQAASYNNHLPAFRQCVQQYSDAQADVNDIYEQYKRSGLDSDMTNKINEFTEIAQKFASGQASQEDVLKVLGNTNLSFLGGILLGGVGVAMVPKLLNDKKEE